MSDKKDYLEVVAAWADGAQIEVNYEGADKLDWRLCLTGAMPGFHPETSYRVYDACRVFKQAEAAGELVEYLTGWGTWAVGTGWLYEGVDASRFRLYDAYRELKDAQTAGRTIQVMAPDFGGWMDATAQGMLFCLPVKAYRIKPMEHVIDPEFQADAAEYAHLNDALDAGLKVAYWDGYEEEWVQVDEFCGDPSRYEVLKDHEVRILGHDTRDGTEYEIVLTISVASDGELVDVVVKDFS